MCGKSVGAGKEQTGFWKIELEVPIRCPKGDDQRQMDVYFRNQWRISIMVYKFLSHLHINYI